MFGNSFFYTTPSYILMNLFFDYTFPDRKLDLTFEPIVNYATISAIEVIDESE